jgi:hypothetical protein
MEVLVPIVVVTIAIGLLLLFLRRPTVVQPPTNATAVTGGPSKTLSTNEDAMQAILDELKVDVPPGGKRVTLFKGNKEIGWTVTRRMKKTSFSNADVADIEGSALELLKKLAPGLAPVNAPPEAELQYPGSTMVLNAFETKSSSDASAGSRDVYKTTLATDADNAQVLAWFRDWLLGHGWQVSPATAASAASSQEYTRGSEHFRLGVAHPAILAPIIAVPIPAGTKTVYEVEYSTASTPSTTP